MNLQDLKDHLRKGEEINAFLEVKAREFNDLMGLDKARGSFDSWELWGDSISVSFYETWRYGGQEDHTFQMPLSALDDDMTAAAAEAKAKRDAEEAARKAAQLKREEDSRRAQFETLKKEFG